MIRHVWSVYCQNSATDEANNVSLFTVYEEMHISPMPPPEAFGEKRFVMLPIQARLVTLWERVGGDEPETALVKIGITDPEGQSADTVGHLELTIEPLRLRSTSSLGAFPFSVPGRYVINVYIDRNPQAQERDWDRVAEIPLMIIVDAAPA